jgi:hypothetical protein
MTIMCQFHPSLIHFAEACPRMRMQGSASTHEGSRAASIERAFS